jgi:hypothetical protein
MKIDLAPETENQNISCNLQGQTYRLAPIKAKHMIAAQRAGGPNAGSVELGFRTLALAMREAMKDDALSYEQLIDLPLKETQPLMELLNQEDAA